MPKRRKSQVTLPKIPSLETATPMAQARRKLDALRAAPRSSEGPSVERLLQAGDTAQIETFSEIVEVAHGDTFEPVAVNFMRMRIDDGPLARLRDRNQLDRKDKGLNLELARAGDLYRQSFFRAGLDPLRALNPAQEVSSAYSPQGLWRCESQVLALQKFRAARAARGFPRTAGRHCVVGPRTRRGRPRDRRLQRRQNGWRRRAVHLAARADGSGAALWADGARSLSLRRAGVTIPWPGRVRG